MNEKLSFFDAISSVLEVEKSYSNDPNDSGGETFWGISSKSHPEILTVRPQHRKELALKIYHEEYWRKLQIEHFDCVWLGWEVFDWSITSGTFWPALRLQESFNEVKTASFKPLVEDAAIGPKTLTSINNWYKFEPTYQFPLYTLYCSSRATFYGNVSGTRYTKGWLKRCFGRTLKTDLPPIWHF